LRTTEKENQCVIVVEYLLWYDQQPWIGVQYRLHRFQLLFFQRWVDLMCRLCTERVLCHCLVGPQQWLGIVLNVEGWSKLWMCGYSSTILRWDSEGREIKLDTTVYRTNYSLMFIIYRTNLSSLLFIPNEIKNIIHCLLWKSNTY